MTARFYDVVIVGMRLGALACAALLSRRDFRVLVVGQDYRPATYRYDDLPLRRRSFQHLVANLPVHRRIVAELAQTQAWKRKLRPLDPMFHFLGARRVEFPPDLALFSLELDRVWPETRAAVEGVYQDLSRLNRTIDSVFAEDAVWPPGSFWERRETNRLRDELPDSTLTLPPELRVLVQRTAQFGSRLTQVHSAPLELARHHGAWSRGPLGLPGDEDEQVATWLERIRAHGGDVRPAERCEGIFHRKNKIVGAQVEGELVSCTFVIGDRPIRSLLDFVRDPEHGSPKMVAEVVERRHVVSLLVRKELVPPPLAAHSFLEPVDQAGPHGGLAVYLHRASHERPAIGSSEPALAALDAELWVAEVVLPDHEPRVPSVRERVLATLRGHFPYLDRHVLLLDSPHDGEPLIDARFGQTTLIERALVRRGGGTVEPELGEAIYARHPESYAGLGIEDVRTPVENLLSVAPTVLPGLAAEGELLAAWGVARIVTKSDKAKEKMRKEMWSKIEV